MLTFEETVERMATPKKKPKPLQVIAGTPDKPLVIGDIEIPCYVLSDETRVLVQRGVGSGLGMSSTSGHRLTKFVGSKNLNPFISNELRQVIDNPIHFEFSGRLVSGYPAKMLVDLCNVVLEARRADKLQKQQAHIADRCEILIRGLATVGIIALIDEATGFQEIRAKRDLATILEQFIAKELQKWTKTFPYEFYSEICRLKGWPPPHEYKRPIVFAKYTNHLVYERLAPGVLDELKRLNPADEQGKRKHKYFQWFTPEHGHPKLRELLSGVMMLMRSHEEWSSFYKALNKASPRFPQS